MFIINLIESYFSNKSKRKVILKKSSSIEDSGQIVWQLVIALLASYMIVYAMLIRGIKVSGKLVYFTSLFPYVVLLILGIRGWMLDGADIGIKFYILPQWDKLADIKVWSDAASKLIRLNSLILNRI